MDGNRRSCSAIESESGEIYNGVCIDGIYILGICAERNAVFHIIIEGETRIKKVTASNWDDKAIPTCGACRELMTLLMLADYKEIMLDYEK